MVPSIQNRKDPGQAPELSARLLYIAASLLVLLGVAATLAAYRYATRGEQERLNDLVEHAALEHLHAVHASAQGMLDSMNSVIGLFLASERVEAREFTKFTAPILQAQPSLAMIGWAPQLSPDGLRTLNETAAREGEAPFVFWQENGTSDMSDRNYAPLYFVEPALWKSARGTDLNANPESALLLKTAKAGAAIAGVRPSGFFPQEDSGCQMFAVTPYFSENANGNHLEGFVVGIIDMSRFLSSTFSVSTATEMDTVLAYRYPDGTLTPIATRLATGESGCGNLITDQRLHLPPSEKLVPPLPIEGGPWVMLTYPTLGFVTANKSRFPLALLLAGLLATAFLCIYLATVIRVAQRRVAYERALAQSARLESVGLLTSGIAHDFNNLLTPILGRVHLALVQLPPDSPVREDIQHIETAARRAGELIAQLLAYAGKAPSVFSDVNLAALIDETTHLMQVSLPRSTRIRTEIQAHPLYVRGSAAQLRQVLVNLIANAADAIGEKEGEIRISLSEAHGSARTDQACLRVTDNGSGIEPQHLPKIFEPFFSTKKSGHGLGLAAIRGIIKLHAGDITVSSIPGEGTTFEIILPTVLPTTLATEPKEFPAAAGSKIAKEREGLCLLADDNADVRTVTSAMLRQLGFEVHAFENGAQVVDALCQSPDTRLAVIDFSMPVMDGKEALAEIRTVKRHLPVLIISANDTAEIREVAQNDPCCRFLAKPYTPETLEKAIATLLVVASIEASPHQGASPS